jgi:HK97 family phage major capsid protein
MSTSTLSKRATRELFRLQKECQALIDEKRGARITQSTRKKVDALLSEMSNIRKSGRTQDEIREEIVDEMGEEQERRTAAFRASHESLFRMYLTKQPDPLIEKRANDFLAGTQNITYTKGSAGGILVPFEFNQSVQEGMAQFDPLLDPNVVNLVAEDGFFLRPFEFPGFDLSGLTAVKVNEAAQHNADNLMAMSQNLTNRYTYRLGLGASFEFEQDQRAYSSTLEALRRAYSVGFARGIGQDLINGNGSTAPQGLLTASVNSGITLDPRIVNAVSNTTNDRFQSAYFSVNRYYRSSPKCGWFMSDSTYQWVRSLSDAQGRPLITIHEESETLMGKPIRICPSMPSWKASISSGKIVFGDASHYCVRLSAMWLRRNLQTPGYVEYGKGLYVGLQMADAQLVDPTGGATPPLVYITLNA